MVCLPSEPGVASLNQLNHITFLEIDYEIISTVILPHLLIQEGHLSVTGESMCRSTV